MEEKKIRVLEITADVCDARKVQESSLACYDEITVKSNLILMSPQARELFSRYRVNLKADRIQVEGEAKPIRTATMNGCTELKPGALPQEGVHLTVNGLLDVYLGSEEVVKSYAGITVNGVVICPEGMAALFSTANINGKLETYPDGAIRLRQVTELDRTFHLRAREGALYYAKTAVVALDPQIDLDALAGRGVHFSTKRLVTTQSLAAKAAPLVNEEADVVILPDGCAYVKGGAVLDEKLLDRYGDKLYVDRAFKVDSRSASCLDRVAFLKVDGPLKATRDMAERVSGKNFQYEELRVVAGTVLSDRETVIVDRAMLEAADQGLGVSDCETVRFAGDVTPDLIRERLVTLSDCETVLCTQAQYTALTLMCKDVETITPCADPLTESLHEDSDEKKEDDGRIVTRIHTDWYEM